MLGTSCPADLPLVSRETSCAPTSRMAIPRAYLLRCSRQMQCMSNVLIGASQVRHSQCFTWNGLSLVLEPVDYLDQRVRENTHRRRPRRGSDMGGAAVVALGVVSRETGPLPCSSPALCPTPPDIHQSTTPIVSSKKPATITSRTLSFHVKHRWAAFQVPHPDACTVGHYPSLS